MSDDLIKVYDNVIDLCIGIDTLTEQLGNVVDELEKLIIKEKEKEGSNVQEEK